MSLLDNFHNFVAALPPPVRDELDTVSTYREVAAGGRLLRAGSPTAEVSQIQEGRVKYCAWDINGRETVLTYMTRGDWVGLSEMFTGLPATWDVVAKTPVSVRVIQRRDFDRLLDKHPQIARQLLKMFALRFTLHRLFGLDHSAVSLKERVIKMLYFLSFSYEKEADGENPVVMNLSQEELGKVVGASRQKLNPALKAIEREGLLDIHLGGVTLRSRALIVQRYGYLLYPIVPTAD